MCYVKILVTNVFNVSINEKNTYCFERKKKDL